MSTTYTYSINLVDSERTPDWYSLCDRVTPGAQDSGRYRCEVTTTQPEALEAALDEDDDVIEYDAMTGKTGEIETTDQCSMHGVPLTPDALYSHPVCAECVRAKRAAEIAIHYQNGSWGRRSRD